MLERALEGVASDFLPAIGVMTLVTFAAHASLVLIAVAIDAPAERDTRVPEHRRLAGTEHFVTARAVRIAMAPGERVARTTVIEPDCGRPRGLRMTIGAGPVGELLSMWVCL